MKVTKTGDMMLEVKRRNRVESRDGKEESEIPIGTFVEYVCHVPLGMLVVKWNNAEWVLNPLATDIK